MFWVKSHYIHHKGHNYHIDELPVSSEHGVAKSHVVDKLLNLRLHPPITELHLNHNRLNNNQLNNNQLNDSQLNDSQLNDNQLNND